jgi:hypothetical protein
MKRGFGRAGRGKRGEAEAGRGTKEIRFKG